MTQWARTTEGDMLLPLRGDGQSALTTDPETCASIKITSVLSFVKGEWVLDTSEGFDWLSIWAQKNPDIPTIKQMFRKALLGINVGMPKVVAITDIATNYDAALRDLKYALSAKLATGQTVTVP